VQHEGEVQVCGHPWHEVAAVRAVAARVAATAALLPPPAGEPTVGDLADRLNATIERVEELLRTLGCTAPVSVRVADGVDLMWKKYDAAWCVRVVGLSVGPPALLTAQSLEFRMLVVEQGTLAELSVKARAVASGQLERLASACELADALANTLEEEV
jgi:hypothetical protein